jgi:hypothetical protein
VLRKVFGPKMGEVTGQWNRLKSDVYDLHSPPNYIRAIKAIPVRWKGHVARMENNTLAYKRLVWTPDGNIPLDPGVDGRLILKWILKEWVMETWTSLIWLRITTGGGRLCMQ